MNDPEINVASEQQDVTVATPGNTRPRWYAVQVASGCEKRVKLNLQQRLSTDRKSTRLNSSH